MAQAIADPRNTPQAELARSPDVPERPRRAPDVQLIGELRESGFLDRQWLLQRNQKFLQVTELIYRIAEYADGNRTLEEIAAAVTTAIDRVVSRDQVESILRTILMPRGLVTGDRGVVVDSGRSEVRSALLVNMRMRMLSPRLVHWIADPLGVLYLPPIFAVLLLGIAVSHAWLYGVHGLDGAVLAALFTPGGLVLVLALMIVSALFHELGHAAALRYAGGRTRGIGAGLYLVYPVFYTDVTDSYRLGRWARLRTDLGGFYFHLIFALGLVGLALATGSDLPLFTVVVIDLMIVRQCLPFVRMDGYWVLADFTGLPDFFSLIGPFLRSLLPASAQNPAAGSLPRLKPWVKAVFVGYLVVVMPLLALLFVLLVLGLPRLLSTAWDAIDVQVTILAGATDSSDVPRALAALIQIVFLGLPVLGIAYLLYAAIPRLAAPVWGWSRRSPRRRIVGTCVAAGVLGTLGAVWAPQINFDWPTWRIVPRTGVQTFQVTQRDHVLAPVVYGEAPPVGGPHASMWQNCGFYADEIDNEHGVHSLEHGAVWITYRRDLPESQINVLRRLAQRETYVLVTAYPDLPSPVVASAWAHRLALESADDRRLIQFVRAYRLAATAPERGGPCSGGVGRPV